MDAWLVANKALLRINDAAREHGQIRAFNNRTFDLAKAPPTVVLRNEDYGRIDRLLADGETVGLAIRHLQPDVSQGHDRLQRGRRDFRASDKAGEIVMLGGHLDSWHSATGATDNAIGSSMMLEAARVIHALGLKPRRTIRVALWAGEEEGLLGSAAYVKQHFGTFENPKPEFAGLDCYFNIDSGTGRVRGASVFGPPEAAAILRAALAPFEDLGVAGAAPSTSRATGGTDSTNLQHAGLPGIGMQQDPIEYQSAHVAHESRHVRAHRARGREEGGHRDRGGRVARCQSERDAAALHQGEDASAAAAAQRRPRQRRPPPRPRRDKNAPRPGNRVTFSREAQYKHSGEENFEYHRSDRRDQCWLICGRRCGNYGRRRESLRRRSSRSHWESELQPPSLRWCTR